MAIKIFSGITVGVVLGYFLAPQILFLNTELILVLIFVALDSIVGGMRAAAEKIFDDAILIAEFLANTIFASIFIWLGNFLGVDIWCIILIALVLRILKNFSALQRHLRKDF